MRQHDSFPRTSDSNFEDFADNLSISQSNRHSLLQTGDSNYVVFSDLNKKDQKFFSLFYIEKRISQQISEMMS
jgi:hypothetical protein